MAAMERLFQLMKEKHASDMFFAMNSPIHLKINGNLLPINQQKMDQANILSLLSEVVDPEHMEQLEVENELNVGIGAAGIGRFRLSAFRQRGSISAVFRYVPGDIPKLDTLHLPPVLSELIMEKRGLILLVGSTGSGKSTTIASMLDHRNEVKTGHILTLEDPIEFLFRSKKSIVNQREIGSDSESLKTALKNSLRQAPDCILIGEIRDLETMMAAIAYAQSGHLVLATLHANNSYQALNRIISFFPMETRNALLLDLSSSIRAIISQRLIRAKDGGRCPAVEIMLNTRYVAELIEQGDIFQIKEAIEKSLSPGSQTFERALMHLIREGLITQEEGLANSDSANNLLWLLNNEASTAVAPKPEPEPETKEEASFTEFTLNV
ncbi:twitching motility protein PilT [Undibacterium sp. YM2]|jgi:twitching motility protein PilU|uniref:PilT/PilU family type 4a pilus ATPase n=1 Tax=unclassified Undibacterium TaxID=2630295 RepID=UPI001331F0BD|nr:MULTISPECIES: PilT/PilU family type 4a pilus ATPase [unclassified Undibacterium]BBB60764.1 twitching motility protein PilT [Undibacterium sp. KW1]BBB66788.1 twitching motility protein PilT [Undibacterium sp. YM2]